MIENTAENRRLLLSDPTKPRHKDNKVSTGARRQSQLCEFYSCWFGDYGEEHSKWRDTTHEEGLEKWVDWVVSKKTSSELDVRLWQISPK